MIMQSCRRMLAIRLFILVLGVMPACALQDAIEPLDKLHNRLEAAENSEKTGSKNEIITEYIDIVNLARKEREGNSLAKKYDQIISSAALNAATLLEPDCSSSVKDENAAKRALTQYEIAVGSGDPDQRALAANNMAVFLSHCEIPDPDPVSIMEKIPFNDLPGDLSSSYYDNYGRLLEKSQRWQDAADQYSNALANAPSDEAAWGGITRLVDKQQDQDKIVFSSNVSEGLIKRGQARRAINLILKTMEKSELTEQNCAQPLSVLARAFAGSRITVKEFNSYDDSLAALAGHARATLFVQELRQVFSRDSKGILGFSISPDPLPYQICRLPKPIIPVVAGLNQAVLSPFQSTEDKNVQRMFFQFLTLGEGQSLSRMLEATGNECVRQPSPDVMCAERKLEEAWMLDRTNTSAALTLALLSNSKSLSEQARSFLINIIVPFYFPPKQRFKALYSESSQQVTLHLFNDRQTDDANRIRDLVGMTPVIRNESIQTDPYVRRIHDGDRVISGVALHKVETVRITILYKGHDCNTNAKESDTNIKQSVIASTNGATGVFTALFERPLSYGDTVCVRYLQNGNVIGIGGHSVAFLPILRRAHNYISAGFFWSHVGSSHRVLLRAALDNDFNLGRWGYDRYQEQSPRSGEPPVTLLVEVFSDLRINVVPKTTIISTQPLTTQTQAANIPSLEFGGYIPLFTQRSTWKFWGQQRAIFIAPLIKGGEDFVPGGGSQATFSSGVRLGILRLFGGTRFVPPELQSYIDVCYGSSTNIISSPQFNSTTVLKQINTNGILKIPETPFYLGFNTAIGPGIKQTGIFAGLRVDFRRLIHGTPLQ